MPQQITDPDALAILGSVQSKPAPASMSGITDPDALDVLSSAKEAPESAVPAPGTSPAARMTALANIKIPELQQAAMGAQEAQSAIDAHLAPDSWLRRGADAVLGNTADAAAGLDHHIGSLPLSLAQLAAHGAAAVGDAISPAQQNLSGLITGKAPQRSGVAGALDNASHGLDNYISQREQTYQAGIPTDVGSILGAAAGEVGPMLAGGEASAGAKLANVADRATSFAQRAPILQKILSGAVQGGAYGALNPATNPDASFASQKLSQVGTGLLLGGAVPAAGAAAGEVYNTVRPIVNPKSAVRDYLGNLLGDQAGAVAARLRSAPTYVPGSVPTSAQAAGSVPLVQAEKALSNQAPDFKAALMDRDISNNAARLDALNKLAGTPADMQAAKEARRAAVDPFVSQYLNPQTRMDPADMMNTLQGLRFGPLGVNAQRAAKLDNLITSIQGATAADGTIGADMADAVRQEAGKLSRGASGQNGLTYGPANDSIVQTIDRVAPGYPDYLRTYAQTSQPITDMGAASAMVDSLGSGARNSAGSPQVTLPALNAQLRKLNSLPYSVSPGMQDTLGGIQQDLQRASISNSVRSPGSDTAYNLNTPGWLASKVYGKQVGQSGPLADMVRKLPLGIGPFLTSIKDTGANRVLSAAQDVMLNPSEMAKELDRIAAKNPRLASLLGRSVQRGMVTAAPQLTNQGARP